MSEHVNRLIVRWKQEANSHEEDSRKLRKMGDVANANTYLQIARTLRRCAQELAQLRD